MPDTAYTTQHDHAYTSKLHHQQQQANCIKERGCTCVRGALELEQILRPLTATLLWLLDCKHDEAVAAMTLELLQAHRRCQLSEFLLLPPLQQARSSLGHGSAILMPLHPIGQHMCRSRHSRGGGVT